MRNIFILIWCENIANTLQKTWFLKKKFLKNFSAKDRTWDLWVMSSLTRPLDQKNLLEKRAKNNASWSAKWMYSKCRAAGISNAQIFKTLRSARQFMLQVGNSNSFDMSSGWSELHTVCFVWLYNELYIAYKVIVFYYDVHAIRALSFGLLHWQSGSGSFAEKMQRTNALLDSAFLSLICWLICCAPIKKSQRTT